MRGDGWTFSYVAQLADEGKSPKVPTLTGLPGCLVLLLPKLDVSVKALFAHAMWARTWFPDRAWLLGPGTLVMNEASYH
ncbi:hypothetical protein [Acidovorax sp. SUPP3334]|uniref:hypothetical protein n=1 Tax=Acidovorax sp. SUPP3334 TaxID=2920881 RepID=UPI0023DE60E7|nr:hypothetical protein [Acidovorax sp. SUPP3334]GKT26063.1 hypothetical protein AVHM3334_19955 [Acidovorax sp. SUPP3334]